MIRGLLLFGVLCLLRASSHAQELPAPSVQWQHDFAGASSNFHSSPAQMSAHTSTSDGGFVFAGTSKVAANFGGDDLWAVKLNAFGSIVWETVFGGSGEDEADFISQTVGGGFLVAGYSSSPPSGNKGSTNWGNYDAWLLRLDADGNRMWEISIGTEFFDYTRSFKAMPDGSCIIGVSTLGSYSPSEPSGNKTSSSFGYRDYWVVRVAADGSILWQNCFGGSAQDELGFIVPLSDGGFCLAGTSDSPMSGNKTSPLYGPVNFWVVRIDDAGTKVWENSYGGGSESLNALNVLPNGDFLLGGSSRAGVRGTKTAPGFGSEDIWLVRLSPTGEQLWDRAFGGNLGDRLTSVEVLPENGFLLAGYSLSGASGNKSAPALGGSFTHDCWLVRVSPSGEKQWDSAFGGSGDDRPLTAQLTKDGAFIIAGTSSSLAGSGNRTSPSLSWYDAWVVRVSSTGEKLWDRSYDLGVVYPPYYASHGRLFATGDGGFLLFGLTDNDTDYYASWAVKLAPEAPILKAPRARELGLGNGFQFFLSGVSNWYMTEYSSDLSQWFTLSTNRLPVTGAEIEITDRNARTRVAGSIGPKWLRTKPVDEAIEGVHIEGWK